MDNDSRPEASEAKPSKKRGGRRPARGFSEFAEKQIPDGAVIDFIFHDDFNGDGVREALIGFTQFTPFPPESSVICIKPAANGYESARLVTDEIASDWSNCGIYDCAAAADTDGDGIPELVISLAAGNGHYTTIFVFDWKEGLPCLAWRSEESFYHGSVEICDADGDKVCEIIAENGTARGSEILELSEASYHIRESYMYKWDGNSYTKGSYPVRMPYLSYNAAVEFLIGLWKQDYRKIYDMAVLPGILGFVGLDDSGFTAFKRFMERNIRPVLLRNLSRGKLEPAEPYDAYCLFCGAEDDFSIELVKERDRMKIQCLSIYKKAPD